eukprot:scaffold91538_cov22-Phaeocystis_antarctica.AAC.1
MTCSRSRCARDLTNPSTLPLTPTLTLALALTLTLTTSAPTLNPKTLTPTLNPNPNPAPHPQAGAREPGVARRAALVAALAPRLRHERRRRGGLAQRRCLGRGGLAHARGDAAEARPA